MKYRTARHASQDLNPEDWGDCPGCEDEDFPSPTSPDGWGEFPDLPDSASDGPEPEPCFPDALEVPTNSRKAGNNSLTNAQRARQERRHAAFRKIREKQEEVLRRRRRFEKDHDVESRDDGVIDTVRLLLPGPLVDLDRRALASNGFFPVKTDVRAIREKDGNVSDVEPGYEFFFRETDGCRLFAWPDRMAVEASIARAAGRTNDRLHELTDRDADTAIKAITIDPFPWSTRASFVSQPEAEGHDLTTCWYLMKIAVTRDYPGDSRRVVQSHEHARWGRTRKPPRTDPAGSKDPDSITWGKWDHRLTVYDKSGEMYKKGRGENPIPGTITRVERQWRGVEVLSKLASFLGSGRVAGAFHLPFLVQTADGPRVLNQPLAMRDLHHALMLDLSALEGAVPPVGPWDEELARAMLRDERLQRALYQRNRKTIRKWEKRMHSIELEDLPSGSLLNACYGTSRSTRPKARE